MSEIPDGWVDPGLDMLALKEAQEARTVRRSDTEDHDPDDEHVQALLRGEDNVADEHGS